MIHESDRSMPSDSLNSASDEIADFNSSTGHQTRKHKQNYANTVARQIFKSKNKVDKRMLQFYKVREDFNVKEDRKVANYLGLQEHLHQIIQVSRLPGSQRPLSS